MIQKTVRITGMSSKLYRSTYLVVCLIHSVFLIALNDIRQVLILKVLPYSVVEHVLRWPHSRDRILRRGCGYHTGTPWSGNLRWGCTGLVSASCARSAIHDDDVPNWGALVCWLKVLQHRLVGDLALGSEITGSTRNSGNVKLLAECGI